MTKANARGLMLLGIVLAVLGILGLVIQLGFITSLAWPLVVIGAICAVAGFVLGNK